VHLNYTLNEDYIVREIDEKLVVVNINDAKYYTFNDVGKLILDHIIQQKDYADLLQSVQTTFDVTRKQFEDDFSLFLREMESKSILSDSVKE